MVLCGTESEYEYERSPSVWQFVKKFGSIEYQSRQQFRLKSTTADWWYKALEKATPQKTCLIDVEKGTQLTYGEVEAQSNQIATWLLDYGVRAQEVICFVMPNKPLFLIYLIAFEKIGAIPALVNVTLTGEVLSRTINMALKDNTKRRLVVVDSSLLGGLDQNDGDVWIAGEEGKKPSRSHEISKNVIEYSHLPTKPVPRSYRASVRPLDYAFLIFTSGTTGLPKAAKFNHIRFIAMGQAFATLMELKMDDISYNTLPLFHTTALIAVTAMWCVGGTLAIRSKFSASNFAKDCRKYGCTSAQYIGEIARYLIASPEHPDDKDTPLRVVCGNGLRPDVWRQFQRRYDIPRIVELYGSTEGNVGLVNWFNKPGSCGYMPSILTRALPFKLFRLGNEHVPTNRVDEEYNPVRGRNGRLIPCQAGEPGEMMGKILDHPYRRFDGYTDKQATEKKIERSVIREGDAWFRTGDLMKFSADGFYYFVDRIGDTFRWHGENVATTEVQEVLERADVESCNVYGVKVPDADGRCGMAAITAKPSGQLLQELFDLGELLPPHARPQFLRFVSETELTATHKLRKAQLRDEGFSMDVKDPMYFRDKTSKSYVKLDRKLYEEICSGKHRF